MAHVQVDVIHAQAFQAGLAPLGDMLLRQSTVCLLYTSDAADDLLCVDLGGRRIIKKKTLPHYSMSIFPLSSTITF